MTRALLLAGAAAIASACAPVLLAPNEIVASRLTRADWQFMDGAHFRRFLVSGERGDTVTALLQSDDFDAMLVLRQWRGRVLAQDDDGGGDCNARLTLVLPRRGVYALYVTTSSGSEIGAFRLDVRRGWPPPPPADTTCRGFGPVAGTVRVGETVMSGLEDGDPRFADSTLLERWTLPVDSGRVFSLDVQSAEFDPVVTLTRGRGEALATDDDGGPGCGARLTYAPPDGRPLRVIVTSSDTPGGQTGLFFLRVSAGSLPRDAGADCPLGFVRWSQRPRRIAVGERQEGRLTAWDTVLPRDGTYAQRWMVSGTASQSVTIDLVSEEFDAYLIVLGPGLGSALRDDDGGGACHARIALMFPQSGAYEIVVNTTEPLETGSFALSVLAAAPPRASGPCPRG